MAFLCPPDCGHCCSNLERAPIEGDEDFRQILREQGIYHCADGQRVGLSLTHAEADALRARADALGLRAKIHPRTYLLETRRRVTVVLDWHLAHASCPFLSDFKCVAYEARPLVCRAYPVMGLGTRDLAPECPKMPVPATQLRSERRARRAVEEAHAKIDELGWLLLDAKGARFAKGLDAREAAARARRYRAIPAEAFPSRAPATS